MSKFVIDKSANKIWALRAHYDGVEFSEVKAKGVGRFGYSSPELGSLLDNLDKHDSRVRFLLNIKAGDWVVYINQPKYGRCTAARTIGHQGGEKSYYWDGTKNDYNHCLKLDKETVFDFARNDAEIISGFSQKFKHRSRYWRIYDTDSWEGLLQAHTKGELNQGTANAESRAKDYVESIKNLLGDCADKIPSAATRKDLEDLIEPCLVNFFGKDRQPEVRRYDAKGSDFLVAYNDGPPVMGIEERKVCVIQVKAYGGKMNTKDPINDIERAFDEIKNVTVTSGLILSSARSTTPDFRKCVADLSKKAGKPVGLIAGDELAAFVLRYHEDALRVLQEMNDSKTSS